MLKYLPLLLCLVYGVHHCRGINWLVEVPAAEHEERVLIEQYFNYVNIVQRLHTENVLEMCRKALDDLLELLVEEEDMQVRANVEQLLSAIRTVQDDSDMAEMQQTIDQALDLVITLYFDENDWRDLFKRCRIETEKFLQRLQHANAVLHAKFSDDGLDRYQRFFDVLDELSNLPTDTVMREQTLRQLNEQRAAVCDDCGQPIYWDYLNYYKDLESDTEQ